MSDTTYVTRAGVIVLTAAQQEKIRKLGWLQWDPDLVVKGCMEWNAGATGREVLQIVGGGHPSALGMMLARVAAAGIPMRKKRLRRRDQPASELELLRNERNYLVKHAEMDPAARRALNRVNRWLAWHKAQREAAA